MNEAIFRGLGLAAIIVALGFVAILFTDVFRKGIPAFTQSNLHLAVTFDPAVVKVDPAPSAPRASPTPISPPSASSGSATWPCSTGTG